MNRRPVVIHYHIFKNAGTSVDTILQHSFGNQWRSFEGAHASDVQNAAALRAFLEAEPEIDAVSTHLGRPPLPWPACLPIVFLRHPVLRARSVYEFTRQDASQPYSQHARQQSFADYVRWALDGGGNGIVIRNYQVVHLSDASFRMADLYKTRAEDDDFLQCRDLLAGWGVVGIVERFAQSTRLFTAAYSAILPGLKFDAPWRNRTNHDSKAIEDQMTEIRADLGANVYDDLMDHNRLDMALYSFGCRLQERP